MNESTVYNTFFDIGMCEDTKKEFGQLRCEIYSDKKKKRVINNELVKKYFTNNKLTKEELQFLKKILDGSIYEDRRNLFEHCKLCSDVFERKDLINFSKKYKYWNICIPTFPYFPYGMMVYLKDRQNLRIENIQDLSDEMLVELMQIEIDLYNALELRVLGEKIVGINILFNQVSKSELCIHGHIEPMILDIDKMDLGCKYIKERPYDEFTVVLNNSIHSSNIIKLPEGIKIPIDKVNIEEVKKTLECYEKNINSYFEKGKMLKNGKEMIMDEMDNLLYNNMVPAAANFVYLTFYNNRFMLSSVPQLTSSFVKMDDITDDPVDLYALCINRNYTGKDDVFLRNYSPLIRPSTKVFSRNCNNDKVLKLIKNMYKELEK